MAISQRYAAPEAAAMNKTKWQMGDTPDMQYLSTAQGAMCESSQPRTEKYTGPYIPAKTKNHSDLESFQGGPPKYKDPNVVYRTTKASDFNHESTLHSNEYMKSEPKYTRLTAGRTNYTLGAYEGKLASTSHTHHAPPCPIERVKGQATIGGWQTGNKYHTDIHARESIMRGGGGGEGSLGTRFDIINGKDDPSFRNRVSMRTGARVSVNKREPWSQGADRYGDHHEPVNILSGQPRTRHNPPPQQNALQLRRPDQPLLATRPW